MMGGNMNTAKVIGVLLVAFLVQHCAAGGTRRYEGDNQQYIVNNQRLFGSQLVITGNNNNVEGDAVQITGNNNRINGNDAIVYGNQARVTGGGDTKIFGNNAFVRGPNSATIVGNNADVVADSVRVDGNNAKIHATASTVVKGNNAQVESASTYVDGNNARVVGDNAEILGNNARVKGNRARVIGNNANVDGEGANVTGMNPRVQGSDALVCSDIGRNVVVSGNNVEIKVLYKYFDGRRHRHDEDPTYYDNRVVMDGERDRAISEAQHCNNIFPVPEEYDYFLEISGNELRVEVDGEAVSGGKKNGNEIVVTGNLANEQSIANNVVVVDV